MKIIRDIETIDKSYKGAVIVLGNFDGFHLGHRAIIAHAATVAKAEKRPLALMSFEPHPKEFLGNLLSKEPYKNMRIYSLRSKLLVAGELGVECVFLMRFNEKFAGLGAEEFIREVLVKKLSAKHVITGENFCFGKNRSGDKNLLAKFAGELGFGYTAHSQIYANDGAVISSSLIRDLLAHGKVREASSLLGRSYHISGRVQHGEKRGSQLGFPTANISLGRKLFLPKYGVYATRVQLENKIYNAVANLGVKPTFGNYAPNLEVHLFDTNENLYGKRLCVEFVDFIRDEQKFSALDELKTQIDIDCVAATKILSFEFRV